ncbi:hypothetical protein LguiB_029014 [Lonicera macranthoides]
MGYVLRVRFASFFAGAAVASTAGLYILHQDYKAAHQSLSQKLFSLTIDYVEISSMGFESAKGQMNGLYENLDGRISALEKLKEVEPTKQVETTD